MQSDTYSRNAHAIFLLILASDGNSDASQALVEDMEALRQHLGIERWVLFGGSWGTTLSLAYALEHTDRCSPYVSRMMRSRAQK